MGYQVCVVDDDRSPSDGIDALTVIERRDTYACILDTEATMSLRPAIVSAAATAWTHRSVVAGGSVLAIMNER